MSIWEWALSFERAGKGMEWPKNLSYASTRNEDEYEHTDCKPRLLGNMSNETSYCESDGSSGIPPSDEQ